MNAIRGPRDLYSGLLFVVIGALTVIIALNYPAGHAEKMGPGYFPRALGGLLMLLGVISVWRSFRLQGAPIARWKWRPIIIVLGSVVVFGHIVQFVGLALSTIFLIFVASAASHEFRWKEAIVIGLLMAVLCVAVFVYALRIQLPIWPAVG